MKTEVTAPLESAKKSPAARSGPFFADPPPPEAASSAWRKWRPLKRVALWEAVALICDIDPDRLSSSVAALFAYLPPLGPMKPRAAINLLRHDDIEDLVRLPSQWVDFKARLAVAERCLDELGCRRGRYDYGYIADFELRVLMTRFVDWATSDDIAWVVPEGFPWTRRPPFEIERRNTNLSHAGAALRALYAVKGARKRAPTKKNVTDGLIEHRGLTSDEANRIAVFIQPDRAAQR